jgi:alpha,alpha-trehalase
MKLSRILVLVALVAAGAHVPGANAPDSQATLRYIHAAWDTLTRSMTDCHSIVDTKVADISILYVPVGISAPPDVAALERDCHVRVVSLPRRIEKLGDVRRAA